MRTIFGRTIVSLILSIAMLSSSLAIGGMASTKEPIAALLKNSSLRHVACSSQQPEIVNT